MQLGLRKLARLERFKLLSFWFAAQWLGCHCYYLPKPKWTSE